MSYSKATIGVGPNRKPANKVNPPNAWKKLTNWLRKVFQGKGYNPYYYVSSKVNSETIEFTFGCKCENHKSSHKFEDAVTVYHSSLPALEEKVKKYDIDSDKDFIFFEDGTRAVVRVNSKHMSEFIGLVCAYNYNLNRPIED